MSAPRIEIVGDAEKAAKYATWARGEWAKVDGTKYGYVDGFAIQYINHDGEGVIRFIELASHAFLCTPRTGTRWSPREVWPGVRGYAISDGIVFALNAKGEIYEGGEYEPFLVGGGAYSPAFQVKEEDEVVVKYPKAGKPNLYGNMLWVSDVGDKILSWQSKYSPGIPHIQMTEPFQAIIYQDGKALEPSPPDSVLGAGRYEKRLYVVCMDGADTIAAILNGREWLEIGRWSTGRLKTPFLLSGNTFSSADGTTITVTEESAEYSTRTSTDSGTATESGEGHDLTFTKSATGWFNGIETRITSRTSSSSSSSSDTDEQTFDVILSGPHVWSAGIDGYSPSSPNPEDFMVGSIYYLVGIQGIYCSWTWNVGANYEPLNDTGTIIRITGGVTSCGMGTISATSDTGYTVSRNVKFPNGIWVLEKTVGTCVYFGYDYGFPRETTLYSGGQKYEVLWYAGYKCDSYTPPDGESIFGIDSNGQSWTFPFSIPVRTIPGSSCNPGCFSSYSVVPGEGWGAIGVCGTCVGCENATAYRYAICYHVYNWVCP